MPTDRDEALADLLEQLHQQRTRGDSIETETVHRLHPDLADEALHLLETEQLLETAADDWRTMAQETASFADTGAEETPGAEESPVLEWMGRYCLVGVLGRGGMGTVYEAFDPQLNRRVALKVPRFTGSEERRQQARQRFLREARSAAAVDHPNVCAVYDAGEAGEQPFVVMAFVAGTSLADRLAEGRFDVRTAVALIAQAADGLAAVHAHGIIHRDLKPGNILLDFRLKEEERGTTATLSIENRKSKIENATPKITDFGLAYQDDANEHLTADGVILGTPAYMAPEQADPSLGETSARSDIYSLGTVLFEMLTGARPFKGTPTQMLAQVSSKPAPRPRDLLPALDPQLDALVAKAMARRPAERYASAHDFAAALRAWLAGTAPTLPLERSPAPRRTRLRQALAASLVATLCVVAGIVWYVRDRDSSTRTNDVHAINPPGTPPSPASTPLRGTIDVHVWRRNQKDQYDPSDKKFKGEGHRLNHPVALPVHPGDGMRIEVQLNRPAYVYVVWLDTEGKATPLYPWDEEWSKRPDREEPRQALRLPEGEGVAPIGSGPAGIESLLLLVRDEPLPLAQDLEPLFAGLPQQNGLELGAAVWIENGQIVRNDPDRGPIKLKQAIAIDDPVVRTQQLLRDKLKPLFPYSRAVCFSNAGDK